jgi:hypothetical protein
VIALSDYRICRYGDRLLDNDGVEMAIADKKSNTTSNRLFIHLNPNIHSCTG